MTTPSFIPGLELSRRLYFEAVRPLLDEAVPGIAHSAAHLGSGSEVLGFDTARSADHEWDPGSSCSCTRKTSPATGRRSRNCSPNGCRRPSTATPPTSPPPRGGHPGQATDGPVHHRVDITDPATWFTEQLGFDPGQDVTALDWLATPTQRFAEVTAGAVFHDGLGQLAPARAHLAWSPPTISGSTCSPASGSASPGRRPSSAGAAKWATNSAPPSSPRAWSAN